MSIFNWCILFVAIVWMGIILYAREKYCKSQRDSNSENNKEGDRETQSPSQES